jgi:hypothetical protein
MIMGRLFVSTETVVSNSEGSTFLGNLQLASTGRKECGYLGVLTTASGEGPCEEVASLMALSASTLIWLAVAFAAVDFSL